MSLDVPTPVLDAAARGELDDAQFGDAFLEPERGVVAGRAGDDEMRELVGERVLPGKAGKRGSRAVPSAS